MKTTLKVYVPAFIMAVSGISLSAYDGSEAFLHYYIVPDNMKAEYKSVCRSLVLSDTASDTLKNAKVEFDLAIPKLLGGSALDIWRNAVTGRPSHSGSPETVWSCHDLVYVYLRHFKTRFRRQPVQGIR